MPLGITTTARIMVKGVGNIFFDINDSDFEIEVGLDGFTMILDPISADLCNDQDLTFDINTTSVGGFTTPIDFAVTGEPNGSTVSLSQNPITPGNSATVTVSNLSSSTGDFTLNVQGTAGAFVRSKDFVLSIGEPTVVPTLISPSNNESDVSLTPTLTWTLLGSAMEYEYELRTAANGGGSLIQSGTESGNSIAVNSNLDPNTAYFWRVRAFSVCNTTAFSNDFTFTTADVTEVCQSFSASNLPASIIRSGRNNPGVTFADISVALDEVITDVKVLNVQGTHTFVGDLAFVLVSPSNTQVVLQDFEDCGNENNFNMGFDDEVSLPTFDCPPNLNNTYQPLGNLSDFDGQNSVGDWGLAIVNYGNFFGSFTNAEIEVCYLSAVEPCDLTVTSTNTSGPGSLQNAISCANPGSVITVNSGLNSIIDLGGGGLTIEKNLTIEANPSDNIIIRYSGSESVLEILENFNLTLSGITFEQDNSLRETNAFQIKYSRATKR
jgi:subtilisin-like proprotein convertase family protein